MRPTLYGWDVRARCPDCGAVTTFEHHTQGRNHGDILLVGNVRFQGKEYAKRTYKLHRCASCGRGGLSEVVVDGNNAPSGLADFYPKSIHMLPLPAGVPDGISREFREAELCASVAAWRAASALLRSTLEKTLKASGYDKGTLAAKIDEAAKDGVITAARSQRAHEDVRVLGNEVVHDDWREVTAEEVEAAHRYAQRIIEDLYDDRPSVEVVLKKLGRVP